MPKVITSFSGRAAGDAAGANPDKSAAAAAHDLDGSATDRLGDVPRVRVTWRTWAYALGAATALGLISVLILHFGRMAAGQPAPLLDRLTTLIDWWTWALFAPVVIWLAYRFPIRGERKLRGIAFHLAAGTIVGLVELAVFSLIAGWYNSTVLDAAIWSFDRRYLFVLSVWFPYALLIYWIIVVAVHAVEYQRRYRERELAASQLRGQLVGAQLQALRMQLHPHFLFNSLNTVAVLMREGRSREAIEMQTRLAGLLRQTLEQEGRERVTLREELEFVEGYLEVEEIRFGDRLSVDIDAAAETLDALVPFMILQPLVENAMRHGVGRKTGSGRIAIRSRRVDRRLAIEVIDNGPGFTRDAWDEGAGLGLSNVRARLQGMYGADHELGLGNGADGGARVSLSIPFTEAAPGAVEGG